MNLQEWWDSQSSEQKAAIDKRARVLDVEKDLGGKHKGKGKPKKGAKGGGDKYGYGYAGDGTLGRFTW